MNVGVVILVFVLWVASLFVAAWVISMNVADIISVGPNIWNVFWIVLTAVLVLGGTSKASS